MKNLIMLFMIALLAIPVPKTYGADVQDLTVTVSDEGSYVLFTVNLIHTGAATDNVFSQAIDLSGLDISGASVQFRSLVGISGRDVNLFIEGSNTKKDTTFESYITRSEWDDFSADLGGDEQVFILDRTFFATDTVTNIASGTTNVINVTDSYIAPVGDSSGNSTEFQYAYKDPALRCRYIRFKSDGQSGNDATVSTQVVLMVPKLPFDRFMNKQWSASRSTGVYSVD